MKQSKNWDNKKVVLAIIADLGLLSDTELFPGRGRDRFYSKMNLVEILIVEELAEYGIPTGKIKSILKYCGLTNDIFEIEDLPGMFIRVDKDGGYSIPWQRDPNTMKTDETIVIDMTGKPSVIIINTKMLIERVKTI